MNDPIGLGAQIRQQAEPGPEQSQHVLLLQSGGRQGGAPLSQSLQSQVQRVPHFFQGRFHLLEVSGSHGVNRENPIGQRGQLLADQFGLASVLDGAQGSPEMFSRRQRGHQQGR